MACKHVYPYGSQDQKYPQHSGCDYCYRLAAKSLWDLELFERCECIKEKQSDMKTGVHLLIGKNSHGLAPWAYDIQRK
jgi:hypothetical protein